MPAAVESAVHVIVRGASVSLRSLAVTTSGSCAVVTFAVQPGTGRTETVASGRSCGRVTTSSVVDAVSDSLGTRKVSAAYPPEAVASGVTRTCAEAGSAVAAAAARARVRAAQERRVVRVMTVLR